MLTSAFSTRKRPRINRRRPVFFCDRFLVLFSATIGVDLRCYKVFCLMIYTFECIGIGFQEYRSIGLIT